jgi:outer membrane receptor protein involved in Fe transport
MSARHLLSAGLVLAPARGIVGDAIVKYVGGRYLNKRNTALAPGYATVDVGAGYRIDRWEIRVDGRNLGDARDAVSESELGDAQYYRMPARRVDVTLGVRF